VSGDGRHDRPWWQRDATEIVAATTSGEVSCLEVTRSVVERIATVNPDVNAVTLDLADQALERAAMLDTSLARGGRPGPLHGVPVTIKDNVDVKGQRTPNGLTGLADLVARQDSPVTGNLVAAGAVVVGRTNTPELSMRPTTDNPLFGLTINPWNRDVSAGGSSGGAGAAVVCGMGALAHGNDIGGSVRIPALHCGVPGIKPTQGRVPAYLPSAAAERTTVAALMSVQGLLARSVADVRLGLAAASAADPRDPWWVPAPLTGPPVPRRVAVIRAPEGGTVHPVVSAAVDRVAAWLADAGYEVVELEDRDTPGLARTATLAFRLLMSDLDHQLTPIVQRLASEAMRAYWDVLRERAEPYPTVGDYIDALASRTTLLRAWLLFLDDHPVVLAPQMLGPLLAVGEDVRSAEDTRRTWDDLAPSIAVNLLGLPSALAPAGLHDGLPTGVQLIASRYREDVCLEAASVVEERAGSLARLLWEGAG
jgi:amidase